MAKTSADKFLATLSQSGLIEPDQLAPVLRELKKEADDHSGAAGAQDLTRRLVDAGLITDWQCQKLLHLRWKQGLRAAH